MVNLGFKQTDRVELGSPYLNQPFSAPPIFNIDELLSVARSRCEVAEDHLWSLQTDPSYLHRTVKLASEGAIIKALSSHVAETRVTLDLLTNMEVYII